MILERVAYVVNVFPKVSETFITHELAEVRRRGIDVRILSIRRSAETHRHRAVERASLAERTVYDRSEFLSTLEEFAPQLIHAHFATEPTAAGLDLAQRMCLPFTFTAHGYDVYRRPPQDFADRAAMASAVIAVSEATARHITQSFGVPRRHIEVVPAGVDLGRFRPGQTAATPPLVLCVARLNPVKNLDLLLEACANLIRRSGVTFRCVIVGDGPERDALQAACRDRGLQGHVELVGPIDHDEIPGWWRRAAVAALTSSSEAMPVSLMEAAACGVPTVATDVGGVSELVEEGVTGLLVPPGDAGAIAESLDRLLRDDALRARMGAAARRRAEERFSIQLQVERLIAIWERALVDSSGARATMK